MHLGPILWWQTQPGMPLGPILRWQTQPGSENSRLSIMGGASTHTTFTLALVNFQASRHTHRRRHANTVQYHIRTPFCSRAAEGGGGGIGRVARGGRTTEHSHIYDHYLTFFDLWWPQRSKFQVHGFPRYYMKCSPKNAFLCAFSKFDLLFTYSVL